MRSSTTSRPPARAWQTRCARHISAGGGKEVLSEQINPGEKDYSALIAKIKQSSADILFYGGLHTEAGLIVRQMRDQGVQTVLMGGDGISNSEFAAIGGDAAAGTLMTSFPGSDDISRLPRMPSKS